MKTKLPIAILAACGIYVGVTTAYAETTTVTINGTAAEICSIPNEPTVDSNATLSEDSSTLTADLANPLNAQLQDPGSIALTYTNVICNYAANIGIASEKGGLEHEGDTVDLVGNMFAQSISYTATANFGDVDLIFNTDGAAISANESIGGAFKGNLVVEIKDFNAGDLPLLEGTYSDTITIGVGAQV